MLIAQLRLSVLAYAAFAAACGGTSRVGDELTAGSLSKTNKAVALIKLGAADPLCTVLAAGIGVREGGDFRVVQTARIERSASETAVAELELGSGEYHLVSYTCTRAGGTVRLAEPAGDGRFKKSYATFSLAPGEILNVGYLQLVPMASTQVTHNTRMLAVRLAITDWPLTELERFKQQRPSLYAQMRTRLMTVPRMEPPDMEQVRAQVRAKCAEMRRLQTDGKLQNLPELCTPAGTPPPQRQPVKQRQIGA